MMSDYNDAPERPAKYTIGPSPGQIALQSWVDETGVPKSDVRTLIRKLHCREVSPSSNFLNEPVCRKCDCKCLASKLNLIEESVSDRFAKLESNIKKDNAAIVALFSRSGKKNLKEYNIFPIKSLEKLDEWTELMATDADLKSYMIETFTLVYDKYKLLRCCFADDVADKFNLTGTHGKMKAMEHGMFKFIFECWFSEDFTLEHYHYLLKTYFGRLRARASVNKRRKMLDDL